MTKKHDLFIELQRSQILSPKPETELVEPCKINEGISIFSPKEMTYFSSKFYSSKKSFCFFIPASGSGSRMFDFLHDFLQKPNDENRGKCDELFKNINSFAFYHKLSNSVKKKINNSAINLNEFVEHLLYLSINKYENLPKALFPFHSLGKENLTPLQEHILQGNLLSENAAFHFTIQERHTLIMESSLKEIELQVNRNPIINLSTQNKESDSYGFLENGELAFTKNKAPIKFPSGHGSLLSNLQSVSSDLIFVKNIDNIQHLSKCKISNDVWSQLAGLAIEIKNEIKKLVKTPIFKDLVLFNERFKLYTESEMNAMSLNESIINFLNRPLRICGMVRNEGQVGGAPFFVIKNGLIQKQIIEKLQVDTSDGQSLIFDKSTHFNPVMMVLDINDKNDQRFNLNNFIDGDQYLKVKKKYNGMDVYFIESPGLWNGKMAKWNSLFVEISNEVFSPVKTVLDLINPAHVP